MAREHHRTERIVSPYLLVILSLIGMIFLGTFLLCTPLSNSEGVWTNFNDNFFMAVSATCVTGLSVMADGLVEAYNLFGQIVMLVMIQIGGLGFLTLLAFVITLFRGRMRMSNRLFFTKATQASSIGEMRHFVRSIVVITLIIEACGFLLCLPVFLTTFSENMTHGVWVSIFHSVSSFCNAGFDILGSTSLMRVEGTVVGGMATWAYNYLLVVTMILIVLGGISFLVIMDIVSIGRKGKHHQLNILTKVVLSTTAVLLVLGFLLFLLTDTAFGNMTWFEALFQSVTTRTAGFATYNQADLSMGGKIFSAIWMFIGGSPLSTAGGVKTTTIFVIFVSIFRSLQGKQNTAFKRRYSSNMVLRAFTLIVIALIVIVLCYVIIIECELNLSAISTVVYDEELGDYIEVSQSLVDLDSNFYQDVFFEVFSAFGTCGLSTGITPYLTTGSKYTIDVLMFIGRLGPVTFLQLFNRDLDKETKGHYSYVEADFLIG
ncbi:MAG: hypothetical protein LUD22_02135 [Coprobacillus sp.]|nr:hypothetical protein [Coprobacillus sp.]